MYTFSEHAPIVHSYVQYKQILIF